MPRAEHWAAAVAVFIAIPLLWVFSAALADGTVREREAPLRGLFGDAFFEAMGAGEKRSQHYLGNEFAAPDFALPDRTGALYRLSDRRGRVVILNFWTVTCQPCLREMPTLESLAKIAAEDWGDVDVVGISTDRGWEDVSLVVPEDSAMTLLFDPDRKVVEDKFGTELFPETWIVDRQGVIRLRYDGALDWSKPSVLDVIDAFR
ncbi:MAG: TlpA disulfide reductase family protein [Myxococcota bacterium]